MRQDKIIESLLTEINRRVRMAGLGGCTEQDNWMSAAALSFALGQVLEQRASEQGDAQ